METTVRSFRRQPDNRRAIFLQLAGSIESQLRQAFAKRNERDGLTQTELAKKLGVDRSAVNRRLTGRSNLTTETIADLVWGLGQCIRVEIFDPSEKETNGFLIVPMEEESAHASKGPIDLNRPHTPVTGSSARAFGVARVDA